MHIQLAVKVFTVQLENISQRYSTLFIAKAM